MQVRVVNSLKEKHMNKMNLVNLKKDPVVKTGLQNRLVIGTQDRMISIPNGYMQWEH